MELIYYNITCTQYLHFSCFYWHLYFKILLTILLFENKILIPFVFGVKKFLCKRSHHVGYMLKCLSIYYYIRKSYPRFLSCKMCHFLKCDTYSVSPFKFSYFHFKLFYLFEIFTVFVRI